VLIAMQQDSLNVIAKLPQRHCETPSTPLRGAFATKQSILSLFERMDCFAALAMTGETAWLAAETRG
jgi:hypothetical protein